MLNRGSLVQQEISVAIVCRDRKNEKLSLKPRLPKTVDEKTGANLANFLGLPLRSALNPRSQTFSGPPDHLPAPPVLCPEPFPGPFPPHPDWPRSRYLQCSCCWRRRRVLDA